MSNSSRAGICLTLLLIIGLCGLMLRSAQSQQLNVPSSGSPMTVQLPVPSGIGAPSAGPPMPGTPGRVPGAPPAVLGGVPGTLGATPTPSVTPPGTPGYGTVEFRPVPVPLGMPEMGRSYYTDSQLAEMQLAAQARDMLKNYSAATNAETQASLKKSLRDVLNAQFDLQHRRRDEELQRIEKRLVDLRSKLAKRADAKGTIVDRRHEQIISDIDGLGWGADDLPHDLFDVGMPGGPPPGMMGTRMMPGMPYGTGSSGGGAMVPGGEIRPPSSGKGRGALSKPKTGTAVPHGTPPGTQSPAKVPGRGPMGVLPTPIEELAPVPGTAALPMIVPPAVVNPPTLDSAEEIRDPKAAETSPTIPTELPGLPGGGAPADTPVPSGTGDDPGTSPKM
ncbi:MAG: hypothetical protein JWM11_6929 [Planctomycetaceae bacterium]|nr:hypothetical protein [Planctomycetaceae bacterium]